MATTGLIGSMEKQTVAGTSGGDTPPAGPGLSVRVVTTGAGFDALEAGWNDLLDRSEATVFQSYEWLRAWWKYFGGRRELRIVVIAFDGSVEGIVPMFLSRERLLGVTVARRLQFIGVGLSDYLQVIASRGNEGRIVEAFTSWLASNQREWDAVDFEDVPEKSPSFALLQAGLEAHGLRVIAYQGTVCPRIDLPGSEAALMSQLGGSSGYNLKRKQKRLKAGFSHEIRLVKNPGDPIGKAMQDFAVIHGGRWKSQGHPSAFDDPHHVAFHEEICRGFARRGWLRIYFLDVEGAAVGVCFSFNFRTTIYMYQSNAHAGDEVMRCSPGLIIRSTAIIDGIAEGMKVFDFMRGDEAYKYREWNAYDERNWLLRSLSRTRGAGVRAGLFLVLEFSRKAADRVRHEYYDYRRYRLSGRDQEVPLPLYALERLETLLGLGGDFIVRHLPFRRADAAGDHGADHS
jgi:CelD/BcsL family acetyltransferase involved in cellulose biosynthesis